MAKLLHLPNKPNLLTPGELEAYKAGGFGGAKLLQEHTPDHLAQLEEARPGGRYFGRLMEPTRSDGSLPSFEWVGTQWFDQVQLLEPLGVLDWQVGVEPNNVCKTEDAYNWQWLTTMALRYLRARLMDYWASLGYHMGAIRYRVARLHFWLGALADGPGHWKEIERKDGWWDAYEVILRQPDLIYGYCVDSYWQYTQHALLDGYGANVVRHRKRFFPVRPDLRYMVAEWACSLVDEYKAFPWYPDHLPPEVIARCQTMMLESYGPWLRWHRANAPFVTDTCLFIGRHSAGWLGFEPGDRVLASIRDA